MIQLQDTNVIKNEADIFLSKFCGLNLKMMMQKNSMVKENDNENSLHSKLCTYITRQKCN